MPNISSLQFEIFCTIGDTGVSEEVPKTGSWAFHFVIIVAMKTTLLTYFLVVPIIPTIAKTFDVSVSTAWQLSTTYEVGKASGSIFIGWLGTRLGVLNAIICGSAVYAILTLVLGFQLSTERCQLADVFVLYGAISAFSIVSQFGLSVLKTSADSKESFRRLVQFQGLASAVLQGASPLLGQVINALSGYTGAPFFIMCANGAISSVLLWWLRPQQPSQTRSTKPSSDAAAIAREPLISGASTLEPTESSYWLQLRLLGFDADYQAFRIYVLILGISTSSLYIFPLLANYVLVQQFHIDGTIANTWILGAFVPNVVLRLIPLWTESVSTDSFVAYGTWCLTAGSGAMLLLAVLFPMGSGTFYPAYVLLPGVVLMAGVGATMPHCKAGAMLNVPDDMNSTANSVLKLMQIICVACMQFFCALVVGPSTVRNQAALLLVASACGTALLARERRTQ